MARVLVVDDKEMMRDSVATTLARRGHTAVSCSSAKQALERIAERAPDAVITDLQMPDMNGLELLQEIRKIDEQLPVLVMTAFGSVETAVQAMKQGAFDYVTKPFGGDELAMTVERALEHARVVRENQILRAIATPSGRAPSTEMVGSCKPMAELRAEMRRIAESHGTVLIKGESGTGKEVAARMIHAMSPRANATFLALNCAALSANLLESELFGHEKGAFTGADRLRKGRFELADGGTLLLDEISEIPPELQAKLLRVLQERAFERVGSSQSRTVDVRVIATTNRDLETEVAEGRFRKDLFFRLDVLPVSMPPLRDRVEDVPELAAHFLALVAAREGKPARRMSADATALLQSYSWPGNVRELQNICERAAVLAMSDEIPASLLRPWLVGSAAPPPVVEVTAGLNGRGMAMPAPHRNGHHGAAASTAVATLNGGVPRIACDGTITLDILEREAILATLERNRGHRQRSARDLGIGVRTLGLKIKKWKEEASIPLST
ncbi:MAG: sigma-54 dependent transcriptional regulator [Phycisphaerales bacterium]